ncbi:MAG: hypothetical protein ACRC2T_00175, partial [Thermoguttaceae bacterium]
FEVPENQSGGKLQRIPLPQLPPINSPTSEIQGETSPAANETTNTSPQVLNQVQDDFDLEKIFGSADNGPNQSGAEKNGAETKPQIQTEQSTEGTTSVSTSDTQQKPSLITTEPEATTKTTDSVIPGFGTPESNRSAAAGSENEPKETIYGFGPEPRVGRTRPVGTASDAPYNDFSYPLTGPPKALRYGIVTDEGILNTPYAPGQAAPKVWSNGREVTMTERAQGAEGYAPRIHKRHTMARHTNVATSLPPLYYYGDYRNYPHGYTGVGHSKHVANSGYIFVGDPNLVVYSDDLQGDVIGIDMQSVSPMILNSCVGLEHCPVCLRNYICGCGEEDCRFCNPDSRIGPSPVCACCDEARPCIHGFKCKGQLGHAPYREYGNTSGGIACPICKEAVERVPCGCCEKCKKGETCELYKPCGKCPSCLVFEKCDLYKAHRNCVLPNKLNSCSRCDNTINGEPCGTCDWCQENSGLNHEPCGHQEVGLLHKKTVYNPYNERALFSAPPRVITNRFNNNASKLPIYYNPAPHYKESSNPSMYVGFQRPKQMRYTCELCQNAPCTCAATGHAGQVAYAYTCKNCDRTPCACAEDICNANIESNPKEVKAQLDALAEANKPQVPTTSDDTGAFVPDATQGQNGSSGQPSGGTPNRIELNDPGVWGSPPPPSGSSNGNGANNDIQLLPDLGKKSSENGSDDTKSDGKMSLDDLFKEK